MSAEHSPKTLEPRWDMSDSWILSFSPSHRERHHGGEELRSLGIPQARLDGSLRCGQVGISIAAVYCDCTPSMHGLGVLGITATGLIGGKILGKMPTLSPPAGKTKGKNNSNSPCPFP